MAKAATAPPGFRDWQAKDLKHLRKIWADLSPDLEAVNTVRKFGDQVLSPSQAGDVFERWILEAFRLSGTTGHYAFEVPLRQSAATLEQIDGMVFEGWQGFLIECKSQSDKVDFSPLARLHYLVEMRPVGTLGLFFSAFGYTLPAQEASELLRPVRVLLFDGADLTWALEGKSFQGRMAEMVRRRWMLAVKLGHSTESVRRGLELFN